MLIHVMKSIILAHRELHTGKGLPRAPPPKKIKRPRGKRSDGGAAAPPAGWGGEATHLARRRRARRPLSKLHGVLLAGIGLKQYGPLI